MQRDWWSDAHLGALSGCDVKDNSGEPVPWTGQAQMLVGNEAGAVGMEDSGGEVYEAKSAGLGLWTGAAHPSPLTSRSSRLPPTPGQMFLPAPPTQAWKVRESKPSWSCFRPPPLHTALGWKGQGLSYHIQGSSKETRQSSGHTWLLFC